MFGDLQMRCVLVLYIEGVCSFFLLLVLVILHKDNICHVLQVNKCADECETPFDVSTLTSIQFFPVNDQTYTRVEFECELTPYFTDAQVLDIHVYCLPKKYYIAPCYVW